MKTISRLRRALRHAGRRFIRDCGAMAATEFAFIVPLMLVLFFGTVDFSAGLAASRKVTLTASSLADLTSEMPANGNIAPIADSDLQNMMTAGISIMNPYLSTPVTATISEIYVDSNTKPTYQWSRVGTLAPGASQASFVTSPHNPGDPVTNLPSALLVKQTYVIQTEVDYTYMPMSSYVVTVGLMAKTGVFMSDFAYSRPRQATCIVYNNTEPTPVNGSCPLP